MGKTLKFGARAKAKWQSSSVTPSQIAGISRYMVNAIGSIVAFGDRVLSDLETMLTREHRRSIGRDDGGAHDRAEVAVDAARERFSVR
jgi:hypothetical protein